MKRYVGQRFGAWVGVLVGSGLLAGCFPLYSDWGDDDSFFDAPVDDGPVTTAARTPPPISGGTLIVSQDGRTAIASDPDRDVVWRVDLERGATQPILSMTRLEENDEPGRVVEDARGRIHVALRRGGAIASFDPAFPQHVQRIPVCPEPRGLVYDADEDTLIVGCTSGDLVTVSASSGEELRRSDLGNDLRDVVKTDGRVYATRFRAAQLLEVGPDGETVSTERALEQPSYEPAVAWRSVAMPGGGVAMAHQLGFAPDLPGAAYYSLVMSSGVTTFDANGTATNVPITAGVLPVDIAVAPEGGQVAVAYAGSAMVAFASTDAYAYGSSIVTVPGVVAVAYARGLLDTSDYGTPDTALVFQTREPAQIGFNDGRAPILLTDVSVEDTGHRIFHTDSGMGVACASCHPEGREDGRTWQFPIEGARRTQNISGGVLDSAPFHWSGDLTNINEFLGEVFTSRMGGARLSEERVSAVARFVQAVPAPVATTSASAASVERGQALFESERTECATCHSGRRLSNDTTVDVGTGEPLQVPSLLGVGLRGPWMHDGCAQTLEDRFGGCGGDKHGRISDLSAQEVQDMIAYLETL